MNAIARTVKKISDFRKFLILIPISIAVGIGLAIWHNSIISILITLAVTGVFVFLSADLALFLIFACLPFSFRYIIRSRGTEIQTPSEPLIGMLIFVLIVRSIFDLAISRRSEDRDKFPFILPVSLFIISTILPMINSPDLLGSIKGGFRAVAYAATCFVIYEVVKNRRDLKRLFFSTFPSGAIATIWTVIVLIYHIDQWQWTSAYYGTPFTNYSVFGSFATSFFLIVLARLLIDREPFDRVAWSMWLIVFGIGILICFSRGVWLSLIVAGGFLIFNFRRVEKFLIIGVAVIFAILMMIIPGVSDLIIERITTVFDFQFASNRSRLLRWAQAFLMFLDHPIIGNGYGSFAMIYEEDVNLSGEFLAQYQLGAHSEYMQILAEQGLFGILTWFWLIIAFFRFGWISLKQIENSFYRSLIFGLMSSELALLIHFFVNNLMNGDAIGIPFWAIYGLLPAIVQMARSDI